MKEGKFEKEKGLTLLFIICFLFIYVVLKAYNLSFTHDEALSFKIINGDETLAKTANNHFLNTWLMYICYHLFGGHEIFLRLPNILAFILYSIFSYKILKKAANFFLMFAGVALLLFNPYMLDFFCVARGYGLAMGFGLGSLYFLCKQGNFDTPKHYFTNMTLALLFSLLAAGSNLICINLNVALLIIILIEICAFIKSKKILFTKKTLVFFALIFFIDLIFLFLLINQLLILRTNKELYFGGPNNFIDDTLRVLIDTSIYNNDYGDVFFKIVKQLIIVIFTLAIPYQVYKKRYSALSKTTIVLFLMIAATILQHYAFDALYPTSRTALIFIPLFAIFMYYLICTIYLEIDLKKQLKFALSICISLLISLPLSWNLIKNINLNYTLEWKDNADVKQVIMEIRREHDKPINKDKKITISNTWFFEPSINYYRVIYAMDYLEAANRNGVNKSSDFTYCTKQDADKLGLNACNPIISRYKESGTVLIKKSVCN